MMELIYDDGSDVLFREGNFIKRYINKEICDDDIKHWIGCRGNFTVLPKISGLNFIIVGLREDKATVTVYYYIWE